ncbi:DUF2192 domain-containing protein [Caldivirga sp.]|uniref:DUF2192 domain-containing protein n=1 Tax=Caldivirga sp. TaxID=2080243 RepID=UPI0025BFF7CF|nr:DUF2192 domain-containing protein [Caldivirga sp.]
MVEVKDLYKERVNVAVELWDKVLRGEIVSRGELVNLLTKYYDEHDIEPFRGLSKIDIYDKELATVYVVGVYGMGLVTQREVKENYGSIFKVELISDEAYGIIKNYNGDESKIALRNLIEDNQVLGDSLEEKVFRVYRLVYTGSVLGFMPEDDISRTYRVFYETFEPLRQRLVNYVKFYIATKIAEGIALGRFSNQNEIRIEKYAYCIRLGLEKCAPNNRLIHEIAASVYKVPPNIINRLVPLVKRSSKSSLIPKAY